LLQVTLGDSYNPASLQPMCACTELGHDDVPAGTIRPMAERLRFWQTTSLVLICAVGVLLMVLAVR
jgi:nitrite reductase (NADH) large subunit